MLLPPGDCALILHLVHRASTYLGQANSRNAAGKRPIERHSTHVAPRSHTVVTLLQYSTSTVY